MRIACRLENAGDLEAVRFRNKDRKEVGCKVEAGRGLEAESLNEREGGELTVKVGGGTGDPGQAGEDKAPQLGGVHQWQQEKHELRKLSPNQLPVQVLEALCVLHQRLGIDQARPQNPLNQTPVQQPRPF